VILGFLLDYWKPLLFLLVFIVGFFVLRWRKRTFNFNERLIWVWVSVPTSLTLAYVVECIVFSINKATATLLGFNVEDLYVIVWPSAITLAVLAFDQIGKYLKSKGRKSRR